MTRLVCWRRRSRGSFKDTLGEGHSFGEVGRLHTIISSLQRQLIRRNQSHSQRVLDLEGEIISQEQNLDTTQETIKSVQRDLLTAYQRNSGCQGRIHVLEMDSQLSEFLRRSLTKQLNISSCRQITIAMSQHIAIVMSRRCCREDRFDSRAINVVEDMAG